MEIGKNMKLYTSYMQTSAGDFKETIKMMPVTLDCPYQEAIFDPSTAVLVVISKTQNEKYQMVPVLNNQGDPMTASSRANGKQFKEQRVKMILSTEYVITRQEEMFDFIEQFAVNTDYPYKESISKAIDLKKEETNKFLNSLRNSEKKDKQEKQDKK